MNFTEDVAPHFHHQVIKDRCFLLDDTSTNLTYKNRLTIIGDILHLMGNAVDLSSPVNKVEKHVFDKVNEHYVHLLLNEAEETNRVKIKELLAKDFTTFLEVMKVRDEFARKRESGVRLFQHYFSLEVTRKTKTGVTTEHEAYAVLEGKEEEHFHRILKNLESRGLDYSESDKIVLEDGWVNHDIYFMGEGYVCVRLYILSSELDKELPSARSISTLSK